MNPLLSKWIRRILVILAIGAVPAGVLAILDAYHLNVLLNLHAPAAVVCAFFGALWGVTLGVLRRSLGSSLLGLNAGAMIGYGYGRFIEPPHNIAHDPAALSAFSLSLAFLGMIVYAQRNNLLHSGLRGGLAGALAALTMIVSLWLVIGMDQRFQLITIVLICVVPWTAGLSVFTWLLLDYFPSRDGRQTLRRKAMSNRTRIEMSRTDNPILFLRYEFQRRNLN